MVKISRDNDGKTRVAKGDKSGLGGQYAPDPAKIVAAKTQMDNLSSFSSPEANLGPVLNQYLKAEKKEVSNDDVRSLLFEKYGAQKLKSGSREMNDGTFLDPYKGETVCRCGEPVSKYVLNNGAHVWSHDENPSKDIYVDMNGERSSYVMESFREEGLDSDSLEMVELNHAAGVKMFAVERVSIYDDGAEYKSSWSFWGKGEDKHSAYPDGFCTAHGVALVEMEVPSDGFAGKLGLKKKTVKRCPKCGDKGYSAGVSVFKNW